MRRRALQLVVASTLVGLAVNTALYACVIELPRVWLMIASDAEFLSVPRASFSRELARLPSSGRTPFEAVLGADQESIRLTEFLSALPGSSSRGSERAAAAEWYQTLRTLSLERQNGEEASGSRSPIDVPRIVPKEFELYLRGAIAYHQDRYVDARAFWTSLLNLPVEKRQKRSTWAAYMIGRSYLEDGQPESSADWFVMTRELAASGFADSLGLAAASLGWEARAALDLERYDVALQLYYLQLQGGDEGARASLIWTAGRALHQGDESDLEQLAQDPMARGIVTAHVVAVTSDTASIRWLEALEATGVEAPDSAAQISWAAYQAGQMDLARRWVERSPEASKIGLWIRSKLFLRDGEIEAAAQVLAQLAAKPEGQRPPDESDYLVEDGASIIMAARAELAAIRMGQGAYLDALEIFQRDPLQWPIHWQDSAYIAERVLTVDELKSYVDSHHPTTGGDGKTGDASTSAFMTGDLDQRRAIRHLLARRLTRVGRWREARPYYPDSIRPRLDAYIDSIRAGHDRSRTPEGRADALFEAATIARHEGMELLATELGPDFFHLGGNYDFPEVAAARAAGGRASRGSSFMGPTEDEVGRVRAQGARPPKRFHYRYVAVDHAWSAAALMPDNDTRTAKILATAGSWLKVRDPEAADRFYKELIRRCGDTPLGREAERIRWFPSEIERFVGGY